MTSTDKSSIAIEAFHFLDYFVIWREDIQEYVLNGRPEEVEKALCKLLSEYSEQNSNAFEKGVSDDTY